MAEALVPTEWTTYNGTLYNGTLRCGYTVSYPPAMEVSDNGAYSQSFSHKLTVPERGARNFIYISVIDQESERSDEEIIYNYAPAEMELLRTLAVGEHKSVRDIANVSAWFTYHRLPDTVIGGHTALAYKNIQPWEFPVGTKELRYFLSRNGCTYLIGGYLDTANVNLPGAITEERFNLVIATIRLYP